MIAQLRKYQVDLLKLSSSETYREDIVETSHLFVISVQISDDFTAEFKKKSLIPSVCRCIFIALNLSEVNLYDRKRSRSNILQSDTQRKIPSLSACIWSRHGEL